MKLSRGVTNISDARKINYENFEDIALAASPCVPLFWTRYVDDRVTALPPNQIDIFLMHLTSINPNVKNTCCTIATATSLFHRTNAHCSVEIKHDEIISDKFTRH